jgi:murein DD-endopeptidase MepM/ murein hydrolase activator NlpD
LPKPTAGVRRILMRLRPEAPRTSSLAAELHRRSLAAADGLRAALETMRPDRDPDALPVEPDPAFPTTPDVAPRRAAFAHRASVVERLPSLRRLRGTDPAALAADLPGHIARSGGRLLGRERAVPVIVAGFVLVASIVSVAPAVGTGGDATAVAAAADRLVVGGGVLVPDEDFSAAEAYEAVLIDERDPGQRVLAAEAGQDELVPVGQYLADGTLLKPVAVDTTVPDVRDRMQTYVVRAGDTLTGIANKFDLSMMTIWWANKLKAKDDLHIGQKLIIPPTDGVVVTVAEGDTLTSIAEKTGGDPAAIAEYNGILDGTVVIGQMLMIPGALGAAIATPTPRPVAPNAPRTSSGSSSGSTVRPPSTYSGGRLYWPIPGHGVNQYYHYGHYGIDIQGKTGDRVHAAAGGTVIFSGWKSNGGGYQVWLAHGSGLYTTYNHLSAVSVRRGQGVARGAVIGRVGATGWATGSHLHFEVWKGPIWNGGRRVNPMAYY